MCPRLCNLVILLRWTVLAVSFCSVPTGCLNLPPGEVLDRPAQSETLPELPSYDDPVWIHAQGLPLKRSWLQEGRTTIPDGEMFLLPHVLSALPYKNNQETGQWVDHVNRNYHPRKKWLYQEGRRLGHYKCMSTSASTILDWFHLQRGGRLAPYRSWMSGKTEWGFDPRVLDALYFEFAASDSDGGDYPLFDRRLDPVEQTSIPVGMEGFCRIITLGSRTPSDRILNAPDSSLATVTHALRVGDWPALNYRVLFEYSLSFKAAGEPEPLIVLMVTALEESGPIFAGIRVRFATSGGLLTATELGRLALPDISGHGVVVVGYIRQKGRTYFVYRETFGEYDETWEMGGPAYRVYPAHCFNEAYLFEPAPSVSVPKSQ